MFCYLNFVPEILKFTPFGILSRCRAFGDKIFSAGKKNKTNRFWNPKNVVS